MLAGTRAIIFVNGELPLPEKFLSLLQPGDWLVAADGGLRHLQRLGLKPALLIGDLDSVAQEDVQHLQTEGVRIECYPVDKNETDLELALRVVLGAGFRFILIAGALGGRIDQTLGNIFLLLSAEIEGCDVRLENGQEQIFIIRRESVIEGAPGDTISLLPLGNPAEGVFTEGLLYPLCGETLFPEHTRGISNVMLAQKSRVSLERGLLLCIHTRKEML
jgi:thiamine pyrophosphokinase